jgi:hypothetical protein
MKGTQTDLPELPSDPLPECSGLFLETTTPMGRVQVCKLCCFTVFEETPPERHPQCPPWLAKLNSKHVASSLARMIVPPATHDPIGHCECSDCLAKAFESELKPQ